MNNEKLLDGDFSNRMQTHLFEKEEIEWEGSPRPGFSITLLESGGYYDAISGPTSIFGLVLGITLIGCYFFYSSGNILGCLATLVIGVSVVLIPDIIKNKRKKNTRYAVTKNRVFFELWRWGKQSIHFIDLAEVENISYQEYADKSGIIHFMARKPFDFDTYDFGAGNRRIYPTFEMVPNVVELQKRLEMLRKDRIRRRAEKG